MKISYGEVFEIFDLQDGKLYWKQPTKGRRKQGALAGNINTGNGCRYIEIQGKNYPASHLVWLLCNKFYSKYKLEHNNGDKTDDRIENLKQIIPKSTEVTQELVNRIFSYSDGILVWKEKVTVRTHCKVGEIAGYISTQKGNEYRYIIIGGKRYKAANLIWLYHYNKMPKIILDHINHVKHDDRIENLREVTNRENSKNRPLSKANTSGVIGVSKNQGKWSARIADLNGHRIDLGRFVKFQDAVLARKSAEKMLNYHKNHGK